MSKILLITSRCFYDARADGICGRNLYNELKKTNDVYLLGYTSKEINNNEILENEYCFYHNRHNTNTNGHIISIKKTTRPVIDRTLLDKYKKYCKRIIKNKNIEVVISIFFPLETLYLQKFIKKTYKNIITISYEVDSATDINEYNSKIGKLHLLATKRFLSNIYRRIDYILIMKCHESHFKKTFKNSVNKMQIIDSPVLLDKKNESFIKKETLNFYYTGYLDKENYSPKPFFDLFKNNLDKSSWRLHFYSRGNCEELIKKESEYDNRIIQHGYVQSTVLEQEIKNADIFLSIDNKTKLNSIPSKAFGYFGMCKPVIHFISKKSFFSDYYMKKYPLGMVVESSKIDENNVKILDFIENVLKREANFNEIKKIFIMNTPEYSANLIDEILK